MELTIIWICNFATLKCVLNVLSIFLLFSMNTEFYISQGKKFFKAVNDIIIYSDMYSLCFIFYQFFMHEEVYFIANYETLN